MPSRELLTKRYVPIVIIIIAAVGMFGILPQFSNFANSLTAMKQASPGLLVMAVGVNLLAYVCAACIYMSLALKPLRFGSTLLVQLAGLLINRVIPAGLGGLGLNFLYLRAHKHGNVQAGAVVALNNVIGLVGHLLLLFGFILFGSATLHTIHVSSQQLWIALAILVVVVVLVVIALYVWQRRWRKAWQQLKVTVLLYRRSPTKLVLALLFSWGLTLSTVLALWLCTRAVGLELNFFTVFVVYSVGVFAGTAIPTPGGLGGLEAAIVTGLVTQHVSAALALAAVLLFRLLSFWLGLAIGAVATLVMQRKGLLRSPVTSLRA